MLGIGINRVKNVKTRSNVRTGESRNNIISILFYNDKYIAINK